MPVSDLTNTTWVWNDEIDVFSGNGTYAINFTSNNTNYMYIRCGTGNISYSEDGTNRVYVYDSGQEPPFIAGWSNNAYKTIEITGGTDSTNATLIAWLQANATQVVSHTLTFDNTITVQVLNPTNGLQTVTSGYELQDGDIVMVTSSDRVTPGNIPVFTINNQVYSGSGRTIDIYNDSIDVTFTIKGSGGITA